MKTVEEVFGMGCNLHKVALAMMEENEEDDVTIDNEGQSVTYLDRLFAEAV